MEHLKRLQSETQFLIELAVEIVEVDLENSIVVIRYRNIDDKWSPELVQRLILSRYQYGLIVGIGNDDSAYTHRQMIRQFAPEICPRLFF